MFRRLTIGALLIACTASVASAAAQKQQGAGVTGAGQPIDVIGPIAPFGLSTHIEIATPRLELASVDVAAPESPTTPASLVTAPVEAPVPTASQEPGYRRQLVGFLAEINDNFADSSSTSATTVQTETLASDVAEQPTDVGPQVAPRPRDEHLAAMIRAHSRRSAARATPSRDHAAEGGPELSFRLRR